MRHRTLLRFSCVLIRFSCVLSLSHQDMAKPQNSAVLTTLANKFSNPVMAMLAIAKSYPGTSLGVTERATSLIDGLTRTLVTC